MLDVLAGGEQLATGLADDFAFTGGRFAQKKRQRANPLPLGGTQKKRDLFRRPRAAAVDERAEKSEPAEDRGVGARFGDLC